MINTQIINSHCVSHRGYYENSVGAVLKPSLNASINKYRLFRLF